MALMTDDGGTKLGVLSPIRTRVEMLGREVNGLRIHHKKKVRLTPPRLSIDHQEMEPEPRCAWTRVVRTRPWNPVSSVADEE